MQLGEEEGKLFVKLFWNFSAFFSLSEISGRNKSVLRFTPTLPYGAETQGTGSFSIIGYSPGEKFSLGISETSE